MKNYVPVDVSYWTKTSKQGSQNSHNKNSLIIHNSSLPEYKEDGLLEILIGERERFLEGAINQLNQFSQERKHIDNLNVDDIENKIVYLNNRILDLQFWPMGMHPGTSLIVERRRSELEKSIERLEQEKRREKTACWNDLLKVTKDIHVLVKEYVELMIRKHIVLNDSS